MLCIAGAAHSHPGEHEQLERINRLIEQQPDEQVLYIRRGSIYSHGGQFERAMADLTRAEELGPAVEVALERGILYLHMRKFPLAVEYLGRYIQRYPNAALAYEYRARAAREAGDNPRAIADLKRYFDLQAHPHPGNYIAAANLLHDMQETDQAVMLLDQGLEKLGPVAPLQHRAIELVLEQGRTANAIARLETLRVPLRESPAWKLEMAELLSRDGRVAEAQVLLGELESDLSQRRITPASLELLEHARDLKRKLAAAKDPGRR